MTMTPSFCTTCGASIPPGTGHYSTPHGLFCVSCGLRIPIIPNIITVIPGQDQDQAPSVRDNNTTL